MRTLRMSLVGAVALALLGGLGSAGLAQDDPTEPVGIVVTLSDFAHVAGGDWVDEADKPYGTNYGQEHSYTWEATDPRLSGAATYRGNWHGYGSLDSQLEGFEWSVVNDEGSWAGTGYGIFSVGARFGDLASVVMHGAGAYEGLTAFLTFDIAHEEDTARGLIIADEMPPFPEPTE